jgi:hypothetical protein
MSCSVNAYQANNMLTSVNSESQGINNTTANNTNNLFANFPNANQLFQQVTHILNNMINSLIANTVSANPNTTASQSQVSQTGADQANNSNLSAVTNANPSEQLHSVNPIHLAARSGVADNQASVSSAALSTASPSAIDTPVAINPSRADAVATVNADSNISLSAAMPSVDNTITSVDPNHLMA